MDFNSIIDKEKMLNALKADGTYLVVNYARRSVGQKGGGHISPVAAYDQSSDTFLILDVNTTDHMWHWIESSMLLKAMNTRDGQHHRGYAIITK